MNKIINAFKDEQGNVILLEEGDYAMGMTLKLTINHEFKFIGGIDASWVILAVSDYKYGKIDLNGFKAVINDCWGSKGNERVLSALN